MLLTLKMLNEMVYLHLVSTDNGTIFINLLMQDDDAEAILAADFEIGHFLRERIVPRSVLYFTGEAIEDDDDDVSCALISSTSKLLY